MYNQYNSNCGSTYNGNTGNPYNNNNGNAYNSSGNRNRSYNEKNRSSCPVEFHLHEVQGSVLTDESDCGCGCHNHRFACISCEPVTLRSGDHAHQVTFRTDTYNGHYHEFSGCTTDAFEICEGHVHYLEGKTSEQAGHCHTFKVITHIENPTED